MLGQQSRRLGPLAGPARAGLTWIDRRAAAPVRRHPLWSAAVASLVFGIVTGGTQAIREGYAAGPALLTVSLLGCGMFAFLVGAGRIPRVRPRPGDPDRPGSPAPRCRRDHLREPARGAGLQELAVVDRRQQRDAAGLPALALLLAITALSVFALVLAIETVLRSHPEPG